MPRAVICEDDPAVRSLVVGVCERAGLEVLAATDRAFEAVELVRRFDADVLVLDLALNYGTGEDVIDELSTSDRCIIVVFSGFASASGPLPRGVHAVVEKPNLEDSQRFSALCASNHRSHSQSTGGLHQIARSHSPWSSVRSGVEPVDTLYETMATAIEGDAVLALRIDEIDQYRLERGGLFATDLTLGLARVACESTRPQDRIGTEDGSTLIVLLLGGNARAAPVVYERIVARWRDRGGEGHLSGGYVVIGCEGITGRSLSQAKTELEIALATGGALCADGCRVPTAEAVDSRDSRGRARRSEVATRRDSP